MKVPETIQLVTARREGDMIRLVITADGQLREAMMSARVAGVVIGHLAAALAGSRLLDD